MSTSCCSCHSPETPAPSRRREWILLGSTTAWFALGLVLTFNAILPAWGVWLWFIPGYLVVGWDVLKTAGRKIIEGRAFDETFLMSIATIGAITIGELPEAMAVMLFYRIGEAVQDLAVDRSRDSIRSLVAIRPDAAHRQTPEGWQTVSPETVNVGESILVKPGERIPLDGEVVSGNSELDTSALTGESVPRRVREGDAALSGCINQSGTLILRVTRPFAESSVSRILELVENARHQKAPTEKFMTRFARRYTPVVVGLALAIALIPPLVLADASLTEWGYRALVLLVISCPCGLVVSIPLGYFGGVGGAARQGILVKGSVFLDRLTQVATVVFDKTGTLTEGTFEVTEIRPQGNWDAKTLLGYAAIAESQSTHPIAKSITRAADLDGEHPVSEVKEIAGCGVRATLTNAPISAVSVGNERLFGDLDFPPYSGAGTIVRVAFDGDYAGDIVVSDRLRDDAQDAVNGLRAIGVERLVMLTGDRQSVGEAVGRSLGLDEVQAELLPQDKSQALEALLRDTRRRGSVAFVGDGINDAPAIALADVGIAMGGLGSDAAIETADVVLMADTPSKLPVAVAVARKTRAIVWQNIAFAMGVKLLVIALGAVGLANLWEAVFADVGVALVAVANATRAFKSGGLPQPAAADAPEPQKTTLSSDVPT